MADNLDYFRVTRPAGIESPGPPPRQPGRYVQCTYELGEADFSRFFSSAALFAWLARRVPYPSPDGMMALQQMGLLWLVLWLAVVAAGAAARAPLASLVAAFWVLLDPGYLLFWNSFYADGAAILALAGGVVALLVVAERWAAGGEVPAGWLAALVLLGLLGSWSKMQYAPFAAVVALALVPLIGDRRRRASLAVASLVLVAGAAGAWIHFAYGSGPRFPWANNYHAAFAGIAHVAAEPEVALTTLGVPARFHDLPRRDVFSAGIGPEHPVHAHLADLSRFRLLTLYAEDPQARWAFVERLGAELALPRTHTRGNHPFSPDGARGPRRDEPGWRASRLRSALLGLHPAVLWLVLAGAGTVCLRALLRAEASGARTVPSLFLLLWFATQAVVVVLGDGFVAFEQHLLGARLALDLLLVLAIVEGGRRVLALILRARRRRPRPQSTQTSPITTPLSGLTKTSSPSAVR